MSLRVFVEVRCEIDPTLNVRIDRQNDQPVAEDGDRLLRISPAGRAGVAAAFRLGGAEVTAYTLGPGHADALRHALAAGAARAVELIAVDDGPAAVSVAELAQWLREERADLVISGKLAGRVAALLGWAHLAGLGELEVHGGVLHAVRHLERGDREAVKARLPAAVRLETESVRPPYVARARVLEMPLARIGQQVLPQAQPSPGEPAGPLQLARPRTRLGALPAPAATSASARLQALLGAGKGSPAAAAPQEKKADATPEQMAEELIRYLAHHGLLGG